MKTLIFSLVMLLAIRSDSLFADQSQLDALQLIATSMVLEQGLKAEMIENKLVAEDATTTTHLIRLKFKNLGEIKAMRKDPKTSTAIPNPALLILSGAGVGMNSISVMETVPGTSVFALDYQIPDKGSDQEKMGFIFTQIPVIQLKIATILLWMQQQPDIDSTRISLINVSFGSFIAPLSLRIADALGFQPAATVFVHGGAQVRNFFSEIAQTYPEFKLADNVNKNVIQFLNFIDPEPHLKFLTGPFLVVCAADDKVIPVQSSLALSEGLPQPKTVLILETGHIGINKPEVINLTMKTVTDWLREQKAI